MLPWVRLAVRFPRLVLSLLLGWDAQDLVGRLGMPAA